jgi:hypothetical protein
MYYSVYVIFPDLFYIQGINLFLIHRMQIIQFSSIQEVPSFKPYQLPAIVIGFFGLQRFYVNIHAVSSNRLSLCPHKFLNNHLSLSFFHHITAFCILNGTVN